MSSNSIVGLNYTCPICKVRRSFAQLFTIEKQVENEHSVQLLPYRVAFLKDYPKIKVSEVCGFCMLDYINPESRKVILLKYSLTESS